VILGDNIFQDNMWQDVSGFKGGGRISLKDILVLEDNNYITFALISDRVALISTISRLKYSYFS
jgi:hypothetical protein